MLAPPQVPITSRVPAAAGTNNTTSSADTITFGPGTANVGDNVNGGGGVDTINVTASSLDLSVVSIANVESLTSGSGAQTVTVSAAQWAGFSTINLGAGADTLNVAASGNISSRLSTPTLSNVETGNLIGTAGTDSITLTGAQLDAIIIGAGTINLGAGSGDTVSLTSTSADLRTPPWRNGRRDPGS